MAARSGAMAQATFANWETNFVVAVTFITLLNTCGALVTFFIYSLLALLGAAIIFRYLPETAGKPLEEVFTGFVNGSGLGTPLAPQRTSDVL